MQLAVRGHPADSIYQRLAADGRVCQSRLGADAGVGRGGADHCLEFVAGGDNDRAVDDGERVACGGWRGCRLLAVLALLASGFVRWDRLRCRFRQDSSARGAAVAADLPVPHYRNILVPLDHSSHDRAAIAHAVALARSHGATLHLLHVEEGVTSQLFGSLSSTEEIISGEEYFGAIVQSLAASGIAAELTIQHGLTSNQRDCSQGPRDSSGFNRDGRSRASRLEGPDVRKHHQRGAASGGRAGAGGGRRHDSNSMTPSEYMTARPAIETRSPRCSAP